MLRGIFIDLNVLLEMDNQAWVVDKKNANTPIVKISKSDFNLIKSGIFKNQGNKVDFNGRTYYLPTDLMNKIKIKTKSYNIDFSNLAISLQEFMNKSLIEEMKFEINKDVILELKNNVDDIYIICSKQTKRTYETIIEKIKEEFEKNGLKIKTFYPISENFMNQNDDDIKFKKMRLLLQHLVGYKTEGDKFKDEEITRYDQIHFYDNYSETLKITKEINNLLEFLLSRSDDGLRSVIKENVQDFKPNLWVHKENENKMNKRSSEKVILNISKIVKTFENFNPYS
jgi:hypothetical protein